MKNKNFSFQIIKNNVSYVFMKNDIHVVLYQIEFVSMFQPLIE